MRSGPHSALNGVDSAERCEYTVGKAAGVEPCRPRGEVCLQHRLRFTDEGRSTIGDFPLARGGSCAAKSHGRLELRPFPIFLFPLRLPSAASLFRAHL